MNWRLNNFDIMFFYDKIKYKEPGEPLRIGKEHWKQTQMDRLETAARDTVKPRIVFVSLDQDEATVAVLRQSGLKEVVTVRSMRAGKQYAKTSR